MFPSWLLWLINVCAFSLLQIKCTLMLKIFIYSNLSITIVSTQTSNIHTSYKNSNAQSAKQLNLKPEP